MHDPGTPSSKLGALGSVAGGPTSWLPIGLRGLEPHARKVVSALTRLPELEWTGPWTIVFLVVCAAALGAHVRLYGDFFIDDGLISLRYSDRLLSGEGLTWTDGERVEGYSNLLWVLLCAVPGLFGFDLISGARVLGFLCVLAGFAGLLRFAAPKRVRDALPVLLAAIALAATDAIGAWTSSGLEVPLGVALLLWAVGSTVRAVESPNRTDLAIASVCYGLLCWTRPDGPLWGCGAALALGFGLSRRARALSVSIIAAVAVFLGAQLLFRRLYYLDWVPNTAYAKVVLNDSHLAQGLKQLGDSFFSLPALWLMFLFGAVGAFRRARWSSWVLVVLASLWVGYLVVVGGDIFPAWRHWGYFAVLAALAWTNWARHRGASWELAPVGASLVVLAIVCTRFDPMNWAWTQRWEWDGQPIARALKVAAGAERPLLAVDAAGSIPFFSRLPALDMLGLTDRYLAHHRPANMGNAAVMGHELGDADYYLARAPDLFCFGVPPCREGGVYRPQVELVARPEFSRDYTLVRLRALGPRHPLIGSLYVRTFGKLGVRALASEIQVPPLVLGRPPHAASELDAEGQLLVRINPGAEVSVAGLVLSAGRWRVRARGVKDWCGLSVKTLQGVTLADSNGAAELELTVTEPMKAVLVLRAGSDGLVSGAVELARAGP